MVLVIHFPYFTIAGASKMGQPNGKMGTISNTINVGSAKRQIPRVSFCSQKTPPAAIAIG
jgi:hypothetical protein